MALHQGNNSALLIILQASSGLWLSFEGLLFHAGV